MPNWVAIVLTGLATLQISLNLYVSAKLLRSAYFEPAQKKAQLFLVWVMPVIGVLLVYLFLQGPEQDKAEESELDDLDQADSAPPQDAQIEISSD